jgi:DNA-binding transcriptional ArsR family regulator
MLDMLSRGEQGAGELARPFRISRPAVSQHLRVLKRAGLVTVRRQGREQIYTLSPQPLREVYHWVERYQTFWSSKLEALGAFLREEKS